MDSTDGHEGPAATYMMVASVWKTKRLEFGPMPAGGRSGAKEFHHVTSIMARARREGKGGRARVHGNQGDSRRQESAAAAREKSNSLFVKVNTRNYILSWPFSNLFFGEMIRYLAFRPRTFSAI